MSYVATKPLKTEQDYREALACLEGVFPMAQPGTPEGDEFELLSLLIADWESCHLDTERAQDPIALISYAMEARGMKITDLAPIMPRGRAYEVLNKKRALSLHMIRWFHENLQLPLEILTRPYPLNK